MTYFEKLCKVIDILRRARKVRKLTQTDLARMINHPDITCSQLLISKIESAADKRVFPEEVINKFLEILPLWCDVLNLEYYEVLELIQEGKSTEDVKKEDSTEDERIYSILKDPEKLARMSNILQKKRVERGWSLKKVASVVGVSHDTIRRMENNLVNPESIKSYHISRYRKWEDLILGEEDPFAKEKESTPKSLPLNNSWSISSEEASHLKISEPIAPSITFHDIVLPNIVASINITELCYLRGKVNGIESLTEDEFKHYQAWELYLWRQNRKD